MTAAEISPVAAPLRCAHRLLPWLCAWLLAGLCSPCALAAEGFRISSAQVRLIDGVYRIDAEVEYALSERAQEALENGVPLVLELEMQLLRLRRYVWDETVASVVQRYRLSHRALSRQYQVENLNSEHIEVFPTLGAAIGYLRRVDNFPLLDHSLLDPNAEYRIALRASLDIESLPTPLRALAYVTPDWHLSSPWYDLEMPR